MWHVDKGRIEILITIGNISPGKRVAKAIKFTGYFEKGKNYNIIPLIVPKVHHFQKEIEMGSEIRNSVLQIYL